MRRRVAGVKCRAKGARATETRRAPSGEYQVWKTNNNCAWYNSNSCGALFTLIELAVNVCFLLLLLLLLLFILEHAKKPEALFEI